MSRGEEDFRSDDIRRLFDQLASERKELHDLTTKIEVFMATRDIEYGSIKKKQEEIEKNQKCIIEHLGKMKMWLYAGSAVLIVVIGLGKAAWWVYENTPWLLDHIKSNG